MKWMDWLKGEGERRHVKRATRYSNPGLTAFYWNGAAPAGRHVKDVSMTGAYLYTKDEWCVGTILDVALKQDEEGAEGAASVFAQCRVARIGPDGIGVSFMVKKTEDRKKLERFIADTAVNKRLSDALRNGNGEAGSSLVEFALVIPLLFVLIAGIVDFGGWIYAWTTVAHAARAGAQYAVLGGVWLDYGGVTAPSATSLANVISSDTAGLPNSASVTVNICEYNNGTIRKTISGTCPGTFTTDNEAVVVGSSPVYSLRTVDVTYTYQPFISAFNFPALGVSLPAVFGSDISVHRRTVMRVVQ